MDTLHSILQVTEDIKKKTKAIYNKSDEDIKSDLQILYDWWDKQPHLPKIKDDDYLERLHMRNKYRVEQTKKKLDAYFTLKGMYPNFFYDDNLSPDSTTFKNTVKASYFIPLRTPLESSERLLFLKIKGAESDEIFNICHFFSYMFMVLEIVNQYDYCASMRLIIDMEGCSFNIYKKMEPPTFIKGLRLFQEAFSCRLSGIDYINAPGFMDLIIKLVQIVIKEAKIKVHSTMEDFFKVVPQKYLPEEYGGEAGKRDDIEDAWVKEVTFRKDFITRRIKLVSNEKLRIGECAYNELFGTEGTFRKLNLD